VTLAVQGYLGWRGEGQLSQTFSGDRASWRRQLARVAPAHLPRVRVALRAEAESSDQRKKYVFPDGSTYCGDTCNGRIHGQGEWRSAQNDVYVGSFTDDMFHGDGCYTDSAGNVYSGQFRQGVFHGLGVYMYSDGRVELGEYAAGQNVGDVFRWSTARNQAWQLRDGQVLREVSLNEAERFASSLGLQVPESIYGVTADGHAQMLDGLARLRAGDEQDKARLSFTGFAPASNVDQGTGSLIAHSDHAIVGASQCDAIVAECEERAAAMGWTTKRHDNYPTTDVPLQRLPRALAWFRDSLLPDVAYPFLARAFDFALPDGAAVSLRVHDAFVVKYSAAGGQRFLKPHRDGSGQQGSAAMFSFNIALNDLDEYTGGGTFFRVLRGSEHTPSGSLRSPKGHILAHASGLMHGGHPIESGIRYILVAFVSIEASHADLAYQFFDRVQTVFDPDGSS